MKKEDIFTDAMGEIDEKYITEHVNNKEKKPFTWRAVKYGTLVAACLVVAIIAITLPMMKDKDIIDSETFPSEVTKADKPTDMKENAPGTTEKNEDDKIIYSPYRKEELFESQMVRDPLHDGDVELHWLLKSYLSGEYDNNLFAVNAVFMSDKIRNAQKSAIKERRDQYDKDLRKLLSQLPEDHIKEHGWLYDYSMEIEVHIFNYLDCPECGDKLWPDLIKLENEKDDDIIKNISREYSEIARKEGKDYLESLGIEYEEVEVTFLNDDDSVHSVKNYTVMYLTKEQIESFTPSKNLIIELELFPEAYIDEDKDGKVALNHGYMVPAWEADIQHTTNNPT